MLPEFYHKCLSSLLTARQYASLRIIVIILQSYRTIQIEKLAALLPIPIKYESRRRHLQRFLVIPQLTPECIWFPLLKKWLKVNHKPKKKCYVAIDRTRWQERNLFVASLIENKRAIPLHWMLLNKKGNSNIKEQKRLIKSVLRLLKGSKIVIIGDREFGNINIADWLSKQGCNYVLRTKSNKYIQKKQQDYQQLLSLGLTSGKSFYLSQVKFTKQLGCEPINIAFYWSKTTKKKRENQGWYLITNLSSLKSAVKAYKKRMGIEAMFKDCKSGGYNLEKCLGTDKRLLSLILLIAIAYTSTIKKGKKIAFMGIQQYVCRLKETFRKDKRHSNFWVGLYGGLWVETFQICHHWVEQLMILTPNKLPFFQKGLRAKELILSTL
jgi:hypothetical protein